MPGPVTPVSVLCFSEPAMCQRGGGSPMGADGRVFRGLAGKASHSHLTTSLFTWGTPAHATPPGEAEQEERGRLRSFPASALPVPEPGLPAQASCVSLDGGAHCRSRNFAVVFI